MQYVWAWVNFVHNLRCLLKNLRSQQKIYATAGPTGPDKYHLCFSFIFLQQLSPFRVFQMIICIKMFDLCAVWYLLKNHWQISWHCDWETCFQDRNLDSCDSDWIFVWLSSKIVLRWERDSQTIMGLYFLRFHFCVFVLNLCICVQYVFLWIQLPAE